MFENITSSTLVTFYENSFAENSKVLAFADINGKQVIITELTPFHPVDSRWPDQPGDKGKVTINDITIQVEDTILLFLNMNSKELFRSDEVQSKNRDNYFYLAGHVLSETISDPLNLIDKPVKLEVSEEYRISLSQGHTYCHLAALAVNSVMHPYFKKNISLDSLGHNDFDKETIKTSLIFTDRSEDVYRLGKSAKKVLKLIVLLEIFRILNLKSMKHCLSGVERGLMFQSYLRIGN